MRITLLQGAFLPVPPLRGGAVEKLWLALGQEFARAGHQIVHLSRAFPNLPAAESLDGVQHVRIGGADRPSNPLLHQLCDLQYTRRALAAAPDADVIVTNTFWAPLLARSRHGSIYVDVQRMPRGQMRLYRRAARLRANSNAVADAIRAEAPRLSHRIRIIPNALPFDLSVPAELTAKRPIVLYAGRIHPEKGIELLLQAWRALQTQGALPGWTLQFVGPSDTVSGGGGDAWFQAMRKRWASDSVQWVGPVYDPAALNRLYATASVFAYPSLAARGETFGSAVLEAMAWGSVPVVSSLACFRDFVVHGHNGIIFDHEGEEPVGALSTALAQAASAPMELRTRALAVRESHAITRIARLFLDDFERLLRSSD